MQIDALCIQIAQELSDAAPGHEFTSWSRELVKAFILEAMQVSYQNRKDIFTHDVILRVTSAGVEGGCGCTEYSRVDGQVMEDGTFLWPLRERPDEVKNVWTGPVCRKSIKQFKLKSYSLTNNNTDIIVYPTPPGGTEVYILASCSSIPTAGDTTDVPDELVPAVVQWVLFKAKAIDAEHNPAIYEVAVTHRNTFFNLLNAQENKEAGNVRTVSARSS